MKKKILCALFAALCQGLFAQGSLYTFIVNVVADGFPMPLIGVANIGRGDHGIAELGVLNINAGSFYGLKAGVVNFTGGDASGVNAGVVNLTNGGFRGLSAGVLNVSGEGRGVQAGVVNYAKAMSGLQIGVLNIVADGENTVPIGLIPIVLRNGYYALELSASDISPVNISFKMGVKKLYTSIGVSYNLLTNAFQFTGGLGTLIDINERLFFNLEVNSHTIINRGDYFLVTVEPAAGINLTSSISLIAGPLLEYEKNGESSSRFFRLASVALDDSRALLLGAKAALRLRL